MTQRGKGCEAFSLMLEVMTTMANDRLWRKADIRKTPTSVKCHVYYCGASRSRNRRHIPAGWAKTNTLDRICAVTGVDS